jgi:anti-anti-sigma factor
MFEYTVTEEASIKCVSAKGRVDALSAPDIQKAFERLILEGERVLLVDMGSVNYVSSAGIRVFLSTQKQLKKVGGEIILMGMGEQVFEIFRMSGLTPVFQIIGGKDEIRAAPRKDRSESGASLVEIDAIRLEYLDTTAERGQLFSLGSQDRTETSSYTEDDVVGVKAASMGFGCGLAALGDRYDEYKDFFGESMVVGGTFFFFPAVKHPSVDFLINAQGNPGTVYRFLYGFGFNGPYRYLISFEGADRPVELKSLVNGFLTISGASVLGLVIVAESKGLWGMHLKKVPLLENKPENGKSVFDGDNFSQWVDFPVEPAFADHVVVSTGIAVRQRDLLRPEVKSLIAGGSTFHLHGGIFEKAPLAREMSSFDKELDRIFNDLQVYKIQHLLGRSRFSGGLAAIVELEE